MNTFQLIQHKLEQFIRKYYTNELLKGTILFFAMGLLYFLLTVSLEYFFWLGKVARTVLFWIFIIVEVGLFFRFILFPLAKLFKFSRGIDYYQASAIIGKHFPNVSDKLLNVIQLQQHAKTTESELLLAGIEQKSKELQPIPFQLAVNFRGNLKYLKYAVIPLLIILAIYISGNSSLFSESYSRVINYNQAYEPPAPFSFFVVNENMQVNENESFTLQIKTQGEFIPEDATIHYNNEHYFLKPVAPGIFEYTFEKLTETTTFHLSANEVSSQSYTIQVNNIPALLNFKMKLDYPGYLNKKNETQNGSGNATIPEGTKVTWLLNTKSTTEVALGLPDTTRFFDKNKELFTTQKQIFKNTYYTLTTANQVVKDYEKLSYNLKVIKDQQPEIEVAMQKDTVSEEMLYFKGRVSDDYGLQKLQLVYYPAENKTDKTKLNLPVSSSNFDEFIHAFPDTLSLKEGTAYRLYFQVFDNDRINGSKVARSQSFDYRKLSREEKEEKQLNNQQDAIKGMSNSLEKMKESNEELKSLDQLQKEKDKLNYNDRKKLENFIKRQQQQEQMMKDFSKKLKENLEEFQPENESPEKQELTERLERNEKKLEENEKLLEELEKYSQKIEKEELNKKLEDLAKKNKNEQKNLEQLVELTKRYYVQEKADKIAKDLEKLAKKQEELSDKEKENTSKAQKELNKKFDELRKELRELEKENKALKNPMKIDSDKSKEASIEKSQKDATENLEKDEQEETESEGESQEENEAKQEEQKSENSTGNKDGKKEKSPQKSAAKKQQKSAAEKMKQMGQKMQMQMGQSGQQQQAEDAKTLRQILDNLVTFSFQQEDLMEDFRDLNNKNPEFANKLKYQQVLRENFNHVDDSLYSLALRNPMISEKITETLTNIEFNIDKSLERLAQNEIHTGVASQQYTLTGANELANMLSQSLDQMQAMMNAQGGGQGQSSPGKSGEKPGQGFQLPDIIKQQESLNKQMQEGMQQGEKGKKAQEGLEGQQQGSSGKEGNGGEGKSNKGENGTEGKEGGEKDGEMGEGEKFGSEKMSGELYKIYQQQQQLRNQLEDMIEREGLQDDAKRLARDMEQVEQELLRHGFTRQTQKRMLNFKHQLMKLENASFQQGKDNKRESETNKKEYTNPTSANLEKAKQYFNTTEILNRQSLPLLQNYKIIVQDYFNQHDD